MTETTHAADQADLEASSRGGAREGAGRKPVENPRSVVFQLRLTQDERDKLDLLALVASAGLEEAVTPSDWLRERIGLARLPDADRMKAAKADAKRRASAKAKKKAGKVAA